jgi:hypothetical protein
MLDPVFLTLALCTFSCITGIGFLNHYPGSPMLDSGYWTMGPGSSMLELNLGHALAFMLFSNQGVATAFDFLPLPYSARDSLTSNPTPVKCL